MRIVIDITDDGPPGAPPAVFTTADGAAAQNAGAAPAPEVPYPSEPARETDAAMAEAVDAGPANIG